ncbi:MAG: hypothetical protein WC071_00795 [Victivallaceae bacterium]
MPEAKNLLLIKVYKTRGKAVLTNITDMLRGLLDWMTLVVNSGAWPDWHFVGMVSVFIVIWTGSAFAAATIAEMAGHRILLHFLGGLALPYIYPALLMLRIKKVEKQVVFLEEVAESGESYQITAKLANIREKKIEARQAKKVMMFEKMKSFQQSQSGNADSESVMPSTDETEQPAEAVQEEQPASVVEENIITPEPQAEVAPAPEPVSGLTRRQIESLAVDNTGGRVGPFLITLHQGQPVTAVSIKGIQDELATFEVQVEDKIKSIRIRYQNIKSCEKMI